MFYQDIYDYCVDESIWKIDAHSQKVKKTEVILIILWTDRLLIQNYTII